MPVTREVDVDASPEEVWEALATEEGRERWLQEPEREISVELVDELGVLCVGGLGPVERDRAHGPVDLVPDHLERPRLS